MTYRITDILKETGPILSGDLKQKLVAEYGLSEDAARKRISRLGKNVVRLRGFFADRQMFISLKGDEDIERYYENLRHALSRKAKRIYAIIRALEFHNGRLSEKQLANYSFSPIQNLKGHRRLDLILKDLIDFELIHKEDDFYVVNEAICLNLTSNERHRQAVENVKQILLIQFNDWARKVGLISYSKGKNNSEFAKFQWGYTAPSYLVHLRKYKGEKLVPGFVVCDVMIGNKVKKEDVIFFIEKIKAVQAINNNPKILPIILVDGVNEEALKLLKQNGVMIAFVDKIFGEKYAELMRSLINLITNAGAILKTKPDQFINLMKNIEKLVGGKTNNLRGDLFELAVGYYHSQSCNTLDIGRKIVYESEKREIDVLAKYAKKIVVAECKGYNYPLDLEAVDTWLGSKIPVIKKWLLDYPDLGGWEFSFELWSTGGFTDDALELLTTRANNTKKYKIEFFGRKEIMAKTKEITSPKFAEIMRDYFIKEKV